MIEKSLAGPIGVFVKFSTLQEYGVDKVFFLENDNVDTSQRNIIFLARGEKATQPMAIAGMCGEEIISIISLYYSESSMRFENRISYHFNLYLLFLQILRCHR